MTIEQQHSDLTSGDADRIGTLGDDLAEDSRTVDDACNEVLDGLSNVDWEQGLAQAHFRSSGEDLYVSSSLASWRLYSTGDALTNAAREYRRVVRTADRLLRTWQGLTPQQREHPATRRDYETTFTELTEGWSDWLSTVAGRLTDDEDDQTYGYDGPDQDQRDEYGDQVGDDRASVEDWARAGALRDFDNHLENGTRRGPRIPDSYLNSGEAWVHQGLSYIPREGGGGEYLMSSYRYDEDAADPANPKESGLTTIDSETGAETGSVRLGGETPIGPPHVASHGPQHSGGTTVIGSSVYVVSTEESGSYVYRYALSDIRGAAHGAEVPARDSFPVPASSYITTTPDGNVYLGDFAKNEVHEFDSQGWTALQSDPDTAPGRTIDTPEGVNGVTVLPDRFVWAQNNTRSWESRMITEPRNSAGEGTGPDGYTVESDNPLVEEPTRAGNSLAYANESGARNFSPSQTPDDPSDDFGKGYDPDALAPQSHMTIDPGGARPAGGEDLAVGTQSLRSSSRVFAGVSDSLGRVRGRTRGTSLPGSTFGTVGGAASMSSAVGTQADKFSDDLDDACRGAETIFEGLRACADGYEVTDLESFNAIESINEMLFG